MHVYIKIYWKDGSTELFEDVAEYCDIGDWLFIKRIYANGDYDQGWYNRSEIVYYEARYRQETEE